MFISCNPDGLRLVVVVALSMVQADACRALSRGLTALPTADVARRGLAPALLTLDGAARLGDAAAHAGPGGRLCPTGCAMLAAILTFPLVSPLACAARMVTCDVAGLAGAPMQTDRRAAASQIWMRWGALMLARPYA